MEKPESLTTEEKLLIQSEKCEILQMNLQFLNMKQELDARVVKFNARIRNNGYVLDNKLDWITENKE